ncbi:MAG: efflux RND transporter periplasmic adaptor subunit [Rickettsiales bacterium]|nr:efflux RND transporter periplasmic adaptor subunit [Rickettsiales bacterium]
MKHIFFLFISGILLTSTAYAHAGHDDAPGDTTSPTTGTITLSDSAIKNLGIETAPATLAPLGKTIEMLATIEYLPERYANITPKANGSVTELLVKLGDPVEKGQALLTFMPVFVGSSPVTLISPIDGYVVKQNAVIGQSLTQESILLEIADTSEVLAKGITYSPSDVEQIKVGQNVKVLTDQKAEPLTGTVQRLDVGLDKVTRTFSVYALINNPKRMLLANTTATLSVSFGEAKDILTVPNKAILGELGEYFIFVREGNSFEKRVVTLGQKASDRTEVIDGVLPDEDVVTVGNYQLQYAKPTAPDKPAESK